MTGTVDMSVVPLAGLILHVGGRDSDAARFLFRRLVDLVIGGELGTAALGQHLGNRGRQRRLAMIDMTDSPDVAMRLGPLHFFLSHPRSPSLHTRIPWLRRSSRRR